MFIIGEFRLERWRGSVKPLVLSSEYTGQMTDQTVQAALSIGVPPLAVMVGILVNNSSLSDLRSFIQASNTDVRATVSDLRTTMDKRFDDAARVQESNLRRVGEVLDARLRHIAKKAPTMPFVPDTFNPSVGWVK